jgi:hypothetical protein
MSTQNKLTKIANMAKRLKQDILEKIKSDPDLFAKVSKAMRIRPGSLPQTLLRNGASLNQWDIVTLVASHLGLEPDAVVEHVSDKSEAQS